MSKRIQEHKKGFGLETLEFLKNSPREQREPQDLILYESKTFREQLILEAAQARLINGHLRTGNLRFDSVHFVYGEPVDIMGFKLVFV